MLDQFYSLALHPGEIYSVHSFVMVYPLHICYSSLILTVHILCVLNLNFLTNPGSLNNLSVVPYSSSG